MRSARGETWPAGRRDGHSPGFRRPSRHPQSRAWWSIQALVDELVIRRAEADDGRMALDPCRTALRDRVELAFGGAPCGQEVGDGRTRCATNAEVRDVPDHAQVGRDRPWPWGFVNGHALAGGNEVRARWSLLEHEAGAELSGPSLPGANPDCLGSGDGHDVPFGRNRSPSRSPAASARRSRRGAVHSIPWGFLPRRHDRPSSRPTLVVGGSPVAPAATPVSELGARSPRTHRPSPHWRRSE